MTKDPETATYRGLSLIAALLLILVAIAAIPWYIGWARAVVASFEQVCQKQ